MKKEVLAYLVFGICTTVVNYFTYLIINLFFDYRIATLTAWFISVIFAYITNRKWVFNKSNEILPEFCRFVSGRVLSGLLDIGLMSVTVEYCKMDENIAKILINIIVVILNYFISKIFVFRERR